MRHSLCGMRRKQGLPAPHRYRNEVIDDVETKLVDALQTAEDAISTVRDHADGTR